MPTNAIIFVPAHCADAARWLDHCYTYCLVRGYLPLHVVRRWCDVIAILASGLRAVVVAGRPDHVDGVEFVSERQDAPKPSRRTGRM